VTREQAGVVPGESASFSIDKVQSGASRTGHRFELVLGHILIIVHSVLDVEPGRRASENEMDHRATWAAARRQAMISRKIRHWRRINRTRRRCARSLRQATWQGHFTWLLGRPGVRTLL
jgi:hypothetical protein